jgi:hypothetical protein
MFNLQRNLKTTEIHPEEAKMWTMVQFLGLIMKSDFYEPVAHWHSLCLGLFLLDVVSYACHPSCLGGRDRDDCSLKPWGISRRTVVWGSPWTKPWDPTWKNKVKRTGGVLFEELRMKSWVQTPVRFLLMIYLLCFTWKKLFKIKTD